MESPVTSFSAHEAAPDQGDWLWLGALCARLTQDPGLAEDARQEAWLAAARVSGGAPDRVGLARAVRSFLWKARRAERRRAGREREAARAEGLPSTDELVARGEQQRRVLDALLALEEPFRSTLLARFQEGLDPREIAERGASPVDTVRWRLRRGIELLRDALRADRAGGGLAAVAMGVPSTLGGPPLAQAAAAGAKGALAKSTSTQAAWTLPLLPALGGLLVMKLAFAAAAVVCSVLLLRGLGAPEAEGGELLSGRAAPSVPVEEPDAGSDLVGVDEVQERVASVAADSVQAPPPAAEAEAAAAEPGQARFIGVVVDDAGEPIDGATIEAKAWKGFELSTNSGPDGAFVLDVPADPELFGEVFAHDGEFTTRPKKRFGPRDEPGWLGALRPASEGVFDLGILVLSPAGVVTGRIVGPDGAGIDDGWIGTNRAASSVEPEADGSFRIPHVAPGEQTFDVIARGMIDHERIIEVIAGEVLDLGVVSLEDGPRVSGRVVDAEGRGIPNARVSTRGFTRAWVFEAESDGSFEVPMPTKEVHDLYARADGFISSDGLPVEPGASGVVVTLERIGDVCTILAVDNDSGEPLETFGISVGRGGGPRGAKANDAWGYRTPAVRARKDGRVRLRARPELDAATMVAPGYERRRFHITEAALSPEGQRVEMKRLPSVAGRIVAEGRGAPGVEVELVIGEPSRPQPMDGAIAEPFPEDDPRQALLSMHTIPDVVAIDQPVPAVGISTQWGIKRYKATTDASGRFEIFGCKPGIGRIWVLEEQRGVKSPTLAIPRGGAAELGDFELRALSSLSGRLQVPSGTPFDGHKVKVGEPIERVATTDASGAFDLGFLPAGSYMLEVEGRDDVFVDLDMKFRQHHVRLEPSVGREVTVRLDAHPTAQVELEFSLGGAPMGGGNITFLRPDRESWDHVAGVDLDRHGKGVVTLPAGEDLRVEVDYGDVEVPLMGTVTFPVGASERRFDFDAGAVEVVLPLSLELPEYASLRVRGRAQKDADFSLIAVTHFERRHTADSTEGTRLVLPVVLPFEGECQFVVDTGGASRKVEVLLERVVPIEVIAGKTTRIEL